MTKPKICYTRVSRVAMCKLSLRAASELVACARCHQLTVPRSQTQLGPCLGICDQSKAWTKHLKFEQSSEILNRRSEYFLVVLYRYCFSLLSYEADSILVQILAHLSKIQCTSWTCIARIPPYTLLIKLQTAHILTPTETCKTSRGLQKQLLL